VIGGEPLTRTIRAGPGTQVRRCGSAGVDAAWLFAFVIRFLPALEKRRRDLQLKSTSGKPRGQVGVDAPLPGTIRRGVRVPPRGA
jgi:hypothetical protein